MWLAAELKRMKQDPPAVSIQRRERRPRKGPAASEKKTQLAVTGLVGREGVSYRQGHVWMGRMDVTVNAAWHRAA